MRRVFASVLKILLVAALVTLILAILALTKGVGYENSFNLISATLRVEGHPCAGVDCAFDLDMSYNPFLYPISYATKDGRVSDTFTMVYVPAQTDPHIPSSAELRKSITGNLAWSEMQKNLPYLFALGLVAGFVVSASATKFSSKLKRLRKKKACPKAL